MVGMSDEAAKDFVIEAATSYDICTNIFDQNFNFIVGEHAGGKCVVHDMTTKTAKLILEETLESENRRLVSYLSAQEVADYLKKSEPSKDFFNYFFDFQLEEKALVAKRDETYDCILISQVISCEDGADRFVMLSTVIKPVDSTVQTLRFELSVMMGVLIVVSVGMAFVLSRFISKPIVQLNFASKTLPEGKFLGDAIRGYREVEELSQTLSRSAEEIQKVDKLRRELVANVSHDLRTPLTLISGYSEAMRDLPGENTPENLQTVIDETHRLSDLVSDLLDLSKLEAGFEELKWEEVELVSFIRQIRERYEKMTGFCGYVFRFETTEEHVLVSADPVKLSQVMDNLVNNAIRYCGSDQTVIVRLRVLEGQAVVEVIDHGEGIEKDKLAQIWDRYYRIGHSHSSSSLGTGLGLSIVKKLLVLFGAKYGVDSIPGKGSRFWFALPIILK